MQANPPSASSPISDVSDASADVSALVTALGGAMERLEATGVPPEEARIAVLEALAGVDARQELAEVFAPPRLSSFLPGLLARACEQFLFFGPVPERFYHLEAVFAELPRLAGSARRPSVLLLNPGEGGMLRHLLDRRPDADFLALDFRPGTVRAARLLARLLHADEERIRHLDPAAIADAAGRDLVVFNMLPLPEKDALAAVAHFGPIARALKRDGTLVLLLPSRMLAAKSYLPMRAAMSAHFTPRAVVHLEETAPPVSLVIARPGSPARSRKPALLAEARLSGQDSPVEEAGRFTPPTLAGVIDALKSSTLPTGRRAFVVPAGELGERWDPAFHDPAYPLLLRYLERHPHAAKLTDALAGIFEAEAARPGDVVLPPRDAGSSYVCDAPPDAPPDALVLRPRPGVEPTYLLAFVLGSAFRQQFERLSAGGADVPGVADVTDITDITIILPPREEQQAIARVFAESRAPTAISAGLWRDALRGKYPWLESSLVAPLFSGRERILSPGGWLIYRGEHVRLLDDALKAHEPFPKESDTPRAVALVREITEQMQVLEGTRGPQDAPTFTASAAQKARALRELAAGMRLGALGRSFYELASFLESLMRLDVRPDSTAAPFVSARLEKDAARAGEVSGLAVLLANEGQSPMRDVSVVVTLPGGEIEEGGRHELPQVESGETARLPLRARFPEAGRYELRGVVTWRDAEGVTRQRGICPAVTCTAGDSGAFTFIRNPYVTGTAVEDPSMFFGRGDLLRFMQENIAASESPNTVLLQGNRRAGKTSILKHVIRLEVLAPHVPVLVDMQGLGALGDHLFFGKVWRLIRRALSDDTLPPADDSTIPPADPFWGFLDALERAQGVLGGRRVVLLLDEFEVLASAARGGAFGEGFLPNLLHLLRHRPEVSAIITGSRRAEEWGGLPVPGLKKEVGFLREEEARALICEPTAGRVRHTEESTRLIIDAAACHPYFTQVLCFNLVDRLNSARSDVVTPGVVEEAARETLISADGHMSYMYDSIQHPALQAVLAYMAWKIGEEGVIARADIEGFLHTNRIPFDDALLTGGLHSMAGADLLRVEERAGGHVYGIRIGLVGQWVRRNHALRDVIARARETRGY